MNETDVTIDLRDNELFQRLSKLPDARTGNVGRELTEDEARSLLYWYPRKLKEDLAVEFECSVGTIRRWYYKYKALAEKKAAAGGRK